MIINLRGPNGSGKSTVAYGLIAKGEKSNLEEVELASYTTPGGAERVVTGYWIHPLDLIVIGPYRTACGGCDAIKTQSLVKESVIIAAAAAKHVFFEGVIVSTLFRGYQELSIALKARKVCMYSTLDRKPVKSGSGKFGPMIWAYLDTPLEVCLDRIQQRNGGKPINEQLVADKVRSIAATRTKAEAAGERTTTIRYKSALADVLKLLEG